MALLLTGLPECYKLMIMGFEVSGAKPTLDAVNAKILQDVKMEEVQRHAAMTRLCTFAGQNEPWSKARIWLSRKRQRRNLRRRRCVSTAESKAKCQPKGLFCSFSCAGWKTLETTCCISTREKRAIDEKTLKHNIGIANNVSMKAVARSTAACVVKRFD